MSAASMVRLSWRPENTPPPLQAMLRALAEEYPIVETAALDGGQDAGSAGFQPANAGGQDGRAPRNGGQLTADGASRIGVEFCHDPRCEGGVIERQRGRARVHYGRLRDAGRALGALLAGLVPDGAARTERAAFSKLGIVLDCGHNALVTPRHFRKWLRRLALLGFDTAMVYTEAGYLLPDEPCFGYMRAAYTDQELRDMDNYASALGIEMIGCIQTLGHLEQVLKWAPYMNIRDTNDILLVDEPRTYELIGKMVRHWAAVFRSRRLHVGMDETYALGRGRYLDLHGYHHGLDLYTAHLARVAGLCAEHGLRPMIWSDVLFRLAAASGTHYDCDGRIPDNVRAALPQNLDLMYWDYYSDSEDHYVERIRKHRELGYEPIMASGVWSWGTFWHNWQRTERYGGACIAASRKTGVGELFFTLWADDGGIWEIDSSLAGLAYVAEKCYAAGAVDESILAQRFRAICGSDLATHRAAARINDRLEICGVLWDDPLLAMYLRHAAKDGTAKLREAETYLLGVARDLELYRSDTASGDLGHAWLLAQVIATKTGVAARLFDAYASADKKALTGVRGEIPALLERIEALARSFRTGWLTRCKPFGLEVLQIRLAGQVARYRELAERLDEYVAGSVESIPELDEGRKEPFPPPATNYRALATGSRVF